MFDDIPPLRALKSFEAAARHLSFTKAAIEMHLTQAAVSHQIKGLEERLGIRLFRRINRNLRLTEAGQNYLPDVRQGLGKLLVATERVKNLRPAGVITVSVLPSFATRWLVPRLWKFRERCPDIDVRVSAFEWQVDFQNDAVDVAIRYGRGGGDWPGLAAEHLLGETIFPVCAPSLLRGEIPLSQPSELIGHTLLHDEFSSEDWRGWLRVVGIETIDPTRGLTFSHTSMVLDAAERGHGVALGRSPLVVDDLALGRLVNPFPPQLPSELAYYVVYPPAAKEFRKIAVFRDWLHEEAKASNASLAKLQLEPPLPAASSIAAD